MCALCISAAVKKKGTNIKGTQSGLLPLHSVLHTARELVISKTAYDFINRIVSEPQRNKHIITIKESSSESVTIKSRSDSG